MECQRFGHDLATKVKSLSRVQLIAIPWTAAYHVPPSMGFSRQEYWSGCDFLLQEIFPSQGLNPDLPHCRQMLYCLSHQQSLISDRLQQYVNCELDVQAGFRKGTGTRDQIANICWIVKKARELQKTIYFCFIDCAKAFDCVDHNSSGKF